MTVCRYQRRAAFVAGLLVVAAVGTTACSTHEEPLTRACPTVVGRGVVGMPKIGLSAEELEIQQDC
jgi:hypothetical protein